MTTAVAEFETRMLEYRQALLASAVRMTKQYQDAEDLVQETFLKAYASRDKFRDGTNLRAWLYVILRNCFINTYRKRQRQPAEAWVGDPETRDALMEAADPVPSAEDKALARDVSGPTMKALSEIPEDFKETAYLAFVEGYHYRDIAQMQDIPIGTVMSRLHRARAKVQEKLAA